MSSDLVAMFLVLLVLGGLVGALALLRKRGVMSGELSRKTVHMGMGCIVTSFPWVFEKTWPVGLLALLACAVIASFAWFPLLNNVLRGIERQSYGEIYFPLAVAFAFHYATRDPLLYCPPILMLTFGDALAALIGSRFGRRRFTTHEGFKSWEGSLAFLAAAFLTTFASLYLLSEYSLLSIALISLLLGMIGLVVEAIAWKGLDNLLIPVFGVVAMDAYLGLSPADLLLKLGVLGLLLGICFLRKEKSTLNDSALLGSALALYLVWALVGWVWTLAPLVFFFLFSRVVTFDYRQYRDFQSVTALIGIGLVPFIWIGQSMRATVAEAMFWPFTLSLAIHLTAIWTKRAKTQGRSRLMLLSLAIMPLVACASVVFLPALFAYGAFSREAWILVGTGFVICSMASLVVTLFKRFDEQPIFTLEEWGFRNALSAAGSLAIYLIAIR